MNLGWYDPAGLERAAAIQAASYDFIELALAPVNVEDSASAERALRAVRALPLPALAWNNFFLVTCAWWIPAWMCAGSRPTSAVQANSSMPPAPA